MNRKRLSALNGLLVFYLLNGLAAAGCLAYDLLARSPSTGGWPLSTAWLALAVAAAAVEWRSPTFAPDPR